MNAFLKNEDYHVKKAYVLSNTREITTNGKITYIPIYDVMFLGSIPPNYNYKTKKKKCFIVICQHPLNRGIIQYLLLTQQAQ